MLILEAGLEVPPVVQTYIHTLTLTVYAGSVRIHVHCLGPQTEQFHSRVDNSDIHTMTDPIQVTGSCMASGITIYLPIVHFISLV